MLFASHANNDRIADEDNKTTWSCLIRLSSILLFIFGIIYTFVMSQRKDLFTKSSVRETYKKPQSGLNDTVTIPSSIRIPQINASESCSCGGWGAWHGHNQSTPDCCIAQSTLILWAFADLFEQHGIKYTLKGGSLLGAIRCCQFLSYDYDIDLFVYTSEDRLKEIMDEWVEEQLKAEGILSQIGLTVGGLPWIGDGWGRFERSNFEKGDVHIDFQFGLSPNVSIVPCMFSGRIVECDEDGRNKLEEAYGEDWFIPHRWKNWDKGTLCKECDIAQKEQCDTARKDVKKLYCTKYPNLLIGLHGCR